MPEEKRGYVPPSDTRGTDDKLAKHAEELLSRFRKMLRKNNWHQLPGKMEKPDDLSSDDAELIEELSDFFEGECQKLPSIEVGQGGNRSRDLLRKVTDTIYLYRQVTPDYDADNSMYSIVDKERARELLQDIINERNKQIIELQEENQRAQNMIETM